MLEKMEEAKRLVKAGKASSLSDEAFNSLYNVFLSELPRIGGKDEIIQVSLLSDAERRMFIDLMSNKYTSLKGK